MVNSVVKNIDLDTKDINLRAKKPESVGLTSVARSIIRDSLDGIGQGISEYGTSFGEELDMLERNLAIDGTAVWKTMDAVRNGKKETI